MKCGFRTNKILTAVKETDHTVTTSDEKIIHKNLTSKPSKFQTSRKTEERKRPYNRCRRCGKFSSSEDCETHLRLRTEGDTNNNMTGDEAVRSHTPSTMPLRKKPSYSRVVMYDSSSRDSDSIAPSTDKDSSNTEDSRDETDLRAEIGRKIETLRAQTPAMTSLIGCSTAIAPNAAQPDPSGTSIRGQGTNTAIAEQESTGKLALKQIHKEIKHQVRFELEPRRSERLKTAKRVETLGGVEYF